MEGDNLIRLPISQFLAFQHWQRASRPLLGRLENKRDVILDRVVGEVRQNAQAN
ncbi:hypothetical protein D3C87_2143340 [compost metagenome]